MNGKKLGEILLEEDVLTKRQLNKAIAMQTAGDDRKLGEILVDLGYITVEDITDVMMEQAKKVKAESEKSKRDLVLSQQILKSKTKPKSTPAAPKPAAPTSQPKPIDISEDAVMKTKFALDVKTMISAAVGIASLVGMWYALQADIQEAKELPSLESLYSEEYPSRPEGYNWPRSYEQYKDNVEGLQDEMDEAYGKIEELQEVIKELQQDIKSLERRKRDK
jgi:uncharacterized protein HemX